jgi:hypothetical protein
MKYLFSKNAAITVIILLLIVGNAYQWHNPKVIEVPSGQKEIDPNAWVQRSAYVNRGSLLDSLRGVNEAMKKEIKDSKDQIANLTTIQGKLNLQVDSLKTEVDIEKRNGLQLSSLLSIISSPKPDTTYTFARTFGDELFRVNSEVQFNDEQIENRLELVQLRDIRIDVANTMNDDYTRLLTYVSSQDFETLEYETYTEINPRRRYPVFWIGLGLGAAGVLLLN